MKRRSFSRWEMFRVVPQSKHVFWPLPQRSVPEWLPNIRGKPLLFSLVCAQCRVPCTRAHAAWCSASDVVTPLGLQSVVMRSVWRRTDWTGKDLQKSAWPFKRAQEQSNSIKLMERDSHPTERGSGIMCEGVEELENQKQDSWKEWWPSPTILLEPGWLLQIIRHREADSDFNWEVSWSNY